MACLLSRSEELAGQMFKLQDFISAVDASTETYFQLIEKKVEQFNSIQTEDNHSPPRSSILSSQDWPFIGSLRMKDEVMTYHVYSRSPGYQI